MNIFTFTLLILTTATLSLLLYLTIKHLNHTTQKTIDLAEHHNAIIKNICTIAHAATEFEKTLNKETPEHQRPPIHPNQQHHLPAHRTRNPP